jgi:hypothetical protein
VTFTRDTTSPSSCGAGSPALEFFFLQAVNDIMNRARIGKRYDFRGIKIFSG